MRRRRGNNSLLIRMIVIGVIVTIALLPILAYLGVFKGGKTGLMQMTMINQPLPKVPKQEHSAKKPHHEKPHVASHKAGPKAPQSSKPLSVHVAVSTGKGGSSQTSVVNGSSTKLGVVPQMPPSNPVVPPPPPPPVKPPPVISPTQVAKPSPPVSPPVVETHNPTPPPPHVPVVVAAVAVAQPQPQIPDDLQADDLDSTFGALLTIKTDGTVDVKMEHSTGNQTLDQVAMDAARKWRFHPATKDGVPAESYLHIEFEFNVS